MTTPLKSYEIQSLQHEPMVRKLQKLVQNGELTITKTALENIIKVIDDILENHQKDDYSEAYDKGHEDGFEEGYEQAVAEHKQ